MLKIAICGKACSGKTTVAEIMTERFGTASCTVKFADPIYAAIKALNQSKHRHFMQEFGDLAKKHFGRDVFVRALAEKANMLESEGLADVIICDDLRFCYELEALRSLGFRTVYIESLDFAREWRSKNLGLELNPDHNSESGIDALKDLCDCVIENKAGLAALRKRVIELLEEWHATRCRQDSH